MILAIDPGPAMSAWVIWDGQRVFRHAIANNAELAITLRGKSPFVDMVAIEMIASYGMPVGREVFETCVWIGRFTEAVLDSVGCPVPFVYRLAVKQHLCHDSRAKDGNIRQALIDKVGPQGTKKAPGPTYGLKGDEWAALAVAVTAWDNRQAYEQREGAR